MNRDKNLVFVGVPSPDGRLMRPAEDLFDFLPHNEIAGKKFVCFRGVGGGIGRSRNILIEAARQSGAATAILFDGDINGGPTHVERILKHPEPFVFGLYPAKELVWPLRWVVNWLPGSKADTNGLREALEVGAGWVKIDLAALDAMVEDGGPKRYRPDDLALAGETHHDFFAEGVVFEDWKGDGEPYARKLTEDFYFCHLIRQAGHKVLVDTICQLGHLGTADYLAIGQLIQAVKLAKVPAQETPKPV